MTKKKQFLRSLMVRGFVLTIPLMVFGFFEGRPLVLAQDAKELLKRVDRLYRSDSSHAEMEMEVITENWERTMRMEVWTRGMERTLIKLLAPRKDRGIKTLKLDTQMWNYFPKINKVLKVPPSMMMSSWMGSDFTNDDLVRENTLADDHHARVIDHPKTPGEFHHIELVPLEDTVTVWGKITITIRRDDLMPVRQVYFDERGEKKRVMEFSDVREMGGRLFPAVMEMKTLGKNSRTLIRYLSLEFDPELSENLFSFSQLRKRN